MRPRKILPRKGGGSEVVSGKVGLSRERPEVGHTLIKRKQNFPHIYGNSDGIGCKVIYEEGLPNV